MQVAILSTSKICLICELLFKLSRTLRTFLSSNNFSLVFFFDDRWRISNFYNWFLNMSINDCLSYFLSSDGCSDFFYNFVFMYVMDYRNVLLMNDMSFRFMNVGNVFLMDKFFLYQRLHMLMHDILVMLMNDVLMHFVNHILMMLHNYIFVLLCNFGLFHMFSIFGTLLMC